MNAAHSKRKRTAKEVLRQDVVFASMAAGFLAFVGGVTFAYYVFGWSPNYVPSDLSQSVDLTFEQGLNATLQLLALFAGLITGLSAIVAFLNQRELRKIEDELFARQQESLNEAFPKLLQQLVTEKMRVVVIEELEKELASQSQNALARYYKCRSTLDDMMMIYARHLQSSVEAGEQIGLYSSMYRRLAVLIQGAVSEKKLAMRELTRDSSMSPECTLYFVFFLKKLKEIDPGILADRNVKRQYEQMCDDLLAKGSQGIN